MENITVAEEWRPVPSEPKLLVSSAGRVRNAETGKVMAQCCVGSRPTYFAVKPPGGYQQRKVHHLVLEAFVGPRPTGMQGCHNNGDSKDNCAANLRWDTPKANAMDTLLHGCRKQTLDADTVRHIREVYAGGQETYYTIAARVGVTHTTIQHIVRRITWKHVK